MIPAMTTSKQRFRVERSRQGATLVEYLAGELGVSKRKAKSLLDRRCVFVNERRIWMAGHRLSAGDCIEVHGSVGGSRRAPAPAVIFSDGWYVIVDKKPDIVTCGADGLEGQLRLALGLPGLAAVHRLDRDTSGCVIFAKSPVALERAIELFRQGGVSKQYRAIARGVMREESRSIRKAISGQSSVTHVRVLDANRDASYLAVTIETGRTHQIRLHLASIRHPVVGDRQYGLMTEEDARFRRIGRQMLHASGVRFKHPFTGQIVSVSAPLPGDFRACLGALRLRAGGSTETVIRNPRDFGPVS